MKKLLTVVGLLLVAAALFATGDAEVGNVLRAGTSPDYPPFESLDESGNLVGFDIELMEQIAEIMDVEVEYVQLDFSVIISALNSGQVDLGLSGFTYSPDRDVLFSEPYYMSAQAVVVREDSDITSLNELGDKRLAAGLGTTGEAAALEAYPDAQMVYPDDYLVGFEMLRSGQTDAVIADLGVAQNYAQQDAFRMLDEYLQSEEMSIIVKKGNQDLMDQIDQAIVQFKATEDYQALLEKWELD
jgi:arginine/lysine/histidine transporter system substrate-binding protein